MALGIYSHFDFHKKFRKIAEMCASSSAMHSNTFFRMFTVKCILHGKRPLAADFIKDTGENARKNAKKLVNHAQEAPKISSLAIKQHLITL